MDLHHCLNTFVTVVEEESFARAAKCLYRSAPQISKEIKWLEGRLGVQLLNRTTRALHVTESGHQCYAYAKRSLDGLREFKERLIEHESVVAGHLRVTASVGFGEGVLVPVITQFMSAYPGVTLEVNFTNSTLDLVNENYDIGIRAGHPSNDGMISEQLYESSRAVFAAPAYLDRQGMPEHPQDLIDHHCLMHMAVAASSRWLFKGGESIPIKPYYLCNSVVSLVNATCAGLGCVYLSRFHVESALASGDLVEVLEAYRVRPIPLYICRPRRDPVPKRVNAFIDFIQAAL